MNFKEKMNNLISECKQKKILLLISLVYNFIWSICKIIFGVLIQAYYFCVSGVSTIMFGFSKRLYLKHYDSENEREKVEKTVIVCILIILSGIFFTLYMARLFFISINREYDLILSIMIATFSFTEFVISICNFIKAKKQDDILLKSLRGCSIASSCYAITLTQTALLSATKNMNSVYNGITGVCFGVIVILIGTYLLIETKLKVKKNYTNN